MTRWLQPALDYIPQWLDFQMEAMQRPGCVVAISHRGQIVLERAFGVASLKTGEALTPRHRFRVASHSKSFTAAGIMKLREQKKLRLDDPVGQYLRGKGLHRQVAAVTLQQILSHSAGLLRDSATDTGYFVDARPAPDAKEILAAFHAPPLLAPSTRFKYSNFGFALLGMVIEEITGKPYAAWMQDEIIGPAGLTETVTDMPLPRGTPMMDGHSGKLLLGRRVAIPGRQRLNALEPIGGFVSTARDLALFFHQLSPTAKRSILSTESRREMTRGHWPVPHSTMNDEYGLGVSVGRSDGWPWFGHGGGLQGYLSRTATLPDQELSIAVLTNSLDGMAVPWLDGIIHILQTFARRGPSNRKTDGWRGRWWSLWGCTDLVPMGERVLCAAPGFTLPFQMVSEIELTGRNEGRIVQANGYGNHGEPVRLVRDGRGRVKEVWFSGARLLPRARAATEIEQRYEGAAKAKPRRGKKQKTKRKTR